MGCDAFADKNGTFKITIYDYETGNFLGVVKAEGLKPENKITVEIDKGRSR